MIRWPLLTALLIALYGAPAASQVSCGDRDAMAKTLADKYGEVQMSLGLVGSRLFETWANCITGTWTILRTDAQGRACHMASGENWQSKGCELQGDFT